MTHTKDEALKLALEALEEVAARTVARWALEQGYAGHLEAITAIKQALAAQHEPENEPFVSLASVQEPVAVFELQKSGWEIICDLDWIQTLPFGTKLYTTPPAAAVQEPVDGTQVSKVWWDGEKLMAKPIPLEDIYQPVDWKAEYLKSVESGCITLDELREARAELDATNRQVEILSDALAESRREVAALKINAALDKKAENARELGLDYEPVLKDNSNYRLDPPVAEPVQEPDAYMYASIAGPVVLHRMKPMGVATAWCVQAQLENDIKVSKMYPLAHSVIPLYTTPPAAPVLEGRDWSLLEATQESLREHITEIKRLKAAQPAVPDAMHHTDMSKTLEYIQGWNDCRQAMLEMMK